MSPPGEIAMVNRHGRVFMARVAQRDLGDGTEYLYNRVLDAYQYRLIIPGVEISMQVQDVTQNELRRYLMTGAPVPIREKFGP